MVVDTTGTDVRVKFGDSRSNRSQDIRLPHFVTDVERTTPAYKAKKPYWLCLEIIKCNSFQYQVIYFV